MLLPSVFQPTHNMLWRYDIDRENNHRGDCCCRCMIFDPLNLWLESRESWSEPCPALPQPSPCWQPYPRTTPPWGSSLSVDGTHPTPSCAAPMSHFGKIFVSIQVMTALQILCNKCKFINGDDDASLWQCVKWVNGGRGMSQSGQTFIFPAEHITHPHCLSEIMSHYITFITAL